MHPSFWQILFVAIAIIICSAGLGWWCAAFFRHVERKLFYPCEDEEFYFPPAGSSDGLSGNSHDRRIARRELERADKLRNA